MVSFDKNKRVKEKMRRQRVIYKLRKQQTGNQTVWAEYLKFRNFREYQTKRQYERGGEIK